MESQERISDDEIAYLNVVVKMVENADLIQHSWSAHLSRKYNLDTNDIIERNGSITRFSGGEPRKELTWQNDTQQET